MGQYIVYDENYFGQVISETVFAYSKEEAIQKCNELYGFGVEADFVGYGIV